MFNSLSSSLKRSLSRPGGSEAPPSLPPPVPLPSIPKPPTTDPSSILSLRLAYLSLVLAGPSTSLNPGATSNGFGFLEHVIGENPRVKDGGQEMSIARRTGEIEKQLKELVEGSRDSSVRRFIDSYSLNAQLLKPPPLDAPNEDELSYEAKALILSEISNDIVALERNLREIESFEQQGIVGGGSLEESEALKPDVEELEKNVLPALDKGYGTLEERTSQLLMDYNHYVDTLSELFVEWNRVLEEAEETVKRWEKEDAA